MSRTHLGLQEEWPVVGLPRPQFGHPLRRLVEADPRIVQSRGGQDRRVVVGLDVFVGGVRLHVAEDVGRLDGVAPLLPLGDGQRQRRVEDGVESVDERHLGQDGGEPVRGHVRHCAHQQPARRPPARRQPVG